jgi:3-oxoacyl-[acyl-carrier protein] reductase
VIAIGDVSEEAGAEAVVREAHRGLGRLDILVNNAGAGGRHLGAHAENMSLDDWDIIVRTHLRSTFLCSKHTVPLMREGGFGRIVNTSSMNVTGGGRPGVTNYSAAKAGVIGFTRTLAKEVGSAGITVNAIAPGLCRDGADRGLFPGEASDYRRGRTRWAAFASPKRWAR